MTELDEILNGHKAGDDLHATATRIKLALPALDALAPTLSGDKARLLNSTRSGLEGALEMIGTLDGSAIDGLFVGQIRTRVGTILTISATSMRLLTFNERQPTTATSNAAS